MKSKDIGMVVFKRCILYLFDLVATILFRIKYRFESVTVIEHKFPMLLNLFHTDLEFARPLSLPTNGKMGNVFPL